MGLPRTLPEEQGAIGALCDSILGISGDRGLAHASVTWETDGHPFLAHATSPGAVALFDLQEVLEQGPSVTAGRSDEQVFVADLCADPRSSEWFVFCGEAARLGVRSVWAVPLRPDGVTVGVLTLHGSTPADPTLQHDPILGTIFDALAKGLVLSGHLLDPEGRGDWFTSHSAVVHQAAGMVQVQADTSIPDAMVLLQAHALGNDLSLAEVAQLVVNRALRFDVREGGED